MEEGKVLNTFLLSTNIRGLVVIPEVGKQYSSIQLLGSTKIVLLDVEVL